MATSLLGSRKNRWTFTACWLVWATGHFMMLQKLDINLPTALVDSIGSNALLAGVSVLVIHSLNYYKPTKTKYFYLFVWCLVITFIWSAIVKVSLANIFEEDITYVSFLLKSMPIRFDLAFLVTGCSIITSMLWYNLEEKKML